MAKVFILNIFKREGNRKGIKRLKDVYSEHASGERSSDWKLYL